MKHVLILLILLCLLSGCGQRAEAPESTDAGFLERLRTASPSPTPLDPSQTKMDLCVGNEVISYSLSDMGVVVGSAGALSVDPKLFAAFFKPGI